MSLLESITIDPDLFLNDTLLNLFIWNRSVFLNCWIEQAVICWVKKFIIYRADQS